MNNPILLIDLDGNDWYQSNDGAVFWKDSKEKSLTVNDVKYSNIGEKYTLNRGNTSFNFEQNKVTKMTVSSLTNDDWVGEFTFDSNGKIIGKINCFDASKKMTDKSGARSLDGTGNNQLVTGSEKTTSDGYVVEPTNDTKNGFLYVEDQMWKGNSTRLGVDYKKGGPSGNGGTVDHYISSSYIEYNLKSNEVSIGYLDGGVFQKWQAPGVLKLSKNYLMVGNGQSQPETRTYIVGSVQKNK